MAARLFAVVILLALAGTAHADLRFAINNDTFTELDPPFDDDGFTNDIDIRFWRPRGHYLVGVWLLDRWVTEVGGRRRWDQLHLAATLERTYGTPDLRSLTVRGWAGPVFGGNLGGRWGQNAFHTLCHCGRLLSEGTLQDTYIGDNTAGAMAGVRARGSYGVPHLQGYSVAIAQGAVGSGVSLVDGAVGARLATTIHCTRLSAHAEIAGTRYHVNDPQLAMPGGYGHGWQREWRAGIEVTWSRYHLEYEYRANEGGSGQPLGVIAFTVEYRR